LVSKRRLRFAADATAKALVKLVNTPTGIHNFLFAGIEGMTGRANINVNVSAAGRLCHNNVATAACGFQLFVFWMNICLHNLRLNVVVPPSLSALMAYGYGTVACRKERAY